MSDPLLPVNDNGLVNKELKPVLGAVAMPRNPVGKILKRELREQARALAPAA